MEIKIEELSNRLCELTKEVDLIDHSLDDFIGMKSKTAQVVLVLSECHTILRAIDNCTKSKDDSVVMMNKVRGSIEKVKQELQRVSGEFHGVRTSSQSIHDEIKLLEESLETANKNTGGLQITHSRLKSKVGTCRARAIGAEKDLSNSLVLIESDRSVTLENLQSARIDCEQVIASGKESTKRVAATRVGIHSEIKCLCEFVDRQIRLLEDSKRIKLSAA